MVRSVKNSAKIPILRALMNLCQRFPYATADDITQFLWNNGYRYTDKAVMMNLGRYRKRGLISAEKPEGRYYYYPNHRTNKRLGYLTTDHSSKLLDHSSKLPDIHVHLPPKKKSFDISNLTQMTFNYMLVKSVQGLEARMASLERHTQNSICSKK